ncbi:hypothetical protein FOZ60_005540 [Perkinsus olseni]|uniref:Uncharacterized protein n=1 Tax=Perkinsus olseni TaxID=32597 RepID=A0A7J6PHK0_PEROL|nr:hypothetical protein FOZ60_005540 [Perkinsus olseni]
MLIPPRLVCLSLLLGLMGGRHHALRRRRRKEPVLELLNPSEDPGGTSLLELTSGHRILPALAIPLISAALPAVAGGGLGLFGLGKFTHKKIMDSRMKAFAKKDCEAIFNGTIPNLDDKKHERMRVNCGLYIFSELVKLTKDATTEGSYTMGWEALRPLKAEVEALDPIVDAEKKHNGLRKRRRDLGQALKTLREKLESRFGSSFDKLSRLERNIRDALLEDKRTESKLARETARKFKSNVERGAGKMLANTYTEDAETEAALKKTTRSVGIQQRNLLRMADKGNRGMAKDEKKFQEMDAELHRRLVSDEEEAADILDSNGRRRTQLRQKMTADADHRFGRVEKVLGQELPRSQHRIYREAAEAAKQLERGLSTSSKGLAMSRGMFDKKLDSDFGRMDKRLVSAGKEYQLLGPYLKSCGGFLFGGLM